MSVEPNSIATTEDFEFAALSEAVNYRAAIVDEFAPYLRGRVLEVGAGIGQTTEAMMALPEVDELVGVEPDTRFQNGFRQRLPEVRLVAGTTADLNPGETFDAAVMVNVLEHIEHDVQELRRLREILSERSGHLCILVPARQELYSRLDAHFGHFRRYDRPGLKAVLLQAGFEIESLFYFNVIGYFAWGLRYTLLRGMSFDVQQVRVFDRKIFPIAHRLERGLVRPPFGQSLVAIARAK
ncbi:MAG: class I SAM-dependent methyltransferase [Verrucomicrobia bacterium]|nr:MAG: class I SAM-dependent methyltransferase [Verrucomicrobiota bacterium]